MLKMPACLPILQDRMQLLLVQVPEDSTGREHEHPDRQLYDAILEQAETGCGHFRLINSVERVPRRHRLDECKRSLQEDQRGPQSRKH